MGSSTPHLGLVAGVFGGLFIFGFLYDRFVAWLEAKGYDEGYTALLVVFGVAATGCGVAIINFDAALLMAGAFSCSGFWMIVGNWWRHVQKRKAAQDEIAREASDA
jgi:hypothetical protein